MEKKTEFNPGQSSLWEENTDEEEEQAAEVTTEGTTKTKHMAYSDQINTFVIK